MYMTGFLLIDKPAGITSFDVIARLRRITGEKRIGHAGTLDPFATGLLVVGIGREATREMQKIVGLDKRYEATFVLGASSDTDDITGVLTPPIPVEVTEAEIKIAIKPFVGVIQQVPPTYAAIKVQGKKLYELARAGKPMLVEPRTVTVYGMHLLSITEPNKIELLIHSSSGTYIRSLARDLGKSLHVGGYVEALRRITIGNFDVRDALTLKTLTLEQIEQHLQKTDDFLACLT